MQDIRADRDPPSHQLPPWPLEQPIERWSELRMQCPTTADRKSNHGLVARPTSADNMAGLTGRLGIVALILWAATVSAAGAEAQTGPQPNVLLRPGDVIRLKIWREPELSGDIQVDEHGRAVFPKLGSMNVSDISADSLEERLTHGYAVFLQNPVVDVTPLRRISILGAVKNPGLYPVDPTITLADALALAGGSTSDGNPDKVKLVRGGKKTNLALSRDTRLMDSPIQSGDQVFVPERSWVSRNPGIIAAAITTVGLVAATVISRR